MRFLIARRRRGILALRRDVVRDRVAKLSKKLGIQTITKAEAYRVGSRTQFLLARPRVTSLEWRSSATADIGYVEGFIKKKKEINRVTRLSYRSGIVSDRLPEKYGYLRTRVDPVYSSFIFNKIIDAFSKHGKKKYVRNIFYDLISDEINPHCKITIDTFYWVIQSLRPAQLNLKARRGRVVYTAPILASETKSIMKAIRFFKQSVLSRKEFTCLYDKVITELYDYVWWGGYVNKYYEDYVRITRASAHLRHYRKERMY